MAHTRKKPTQSKTTKPTRNIKPEKSTNPQGLQTSVVGRPAHYQGNATFIESLGDIGYLEVVNVIEAFAIDDAHVSQALKYLLRAGRTDKSTYEEDIAKSIWWLMRTLKYRNAQSQLDPIWER